MRGRLLGGKMMGILTALLVVLLMPIGVAAEERTDSTGQWTYVLEEVGAVITGCAEEPGGDLVIPSVVDGHPVTGVGDRAFDDCWNITGVTIPEGVTSIGQGAFISCTSLTSATIPGSVTSMGSGVFAGCTGLTSVTIADGVTRIGSFAFEDCRLTEVIIPDSVTEIGNGAFHGCAGLANIIIPDSVSGIGDFAFYGCDFTEVNIPAGVTHISDGAFSYCDRLAALTIPDSVTGIGEAAFAGCAALTALTIPDSVTEIGEEAFAGCAALTALTIPDSVTEIGKNAFANCGDLTLIVTADSYALQYAQSNRIPAVFTAENHTAEFHFQRGQALSRLGRHEEAEQAFAKAVEIEPDNAKYLCEYGSTAAWYNGRVQEGYEALEKAVALEPLSGEYVGDRGVILHLLGRTDEAASELKRAIEMDPEYTNAYYFIAMALYDLGEYEEAARNCEEYLDRIPQGDDVLVLLGDARFMMGQTAAALAAYDEAIAYRYHTAGSIKNYAAVKRARMAEIAAQHYTDDIEEVSVSTAGELLAALGSNRRILLEEGVYNLTAAEPGFQNSANVYFEECYDGSELVLDGVHNLTILGAGDARSEIIVEPRYANVINFIHCTNIGVENIEAGHTDGGECSGGVLLFENSTGVRIDNAAMYGCGTIGVSLYDTTDVTVSRSEVYGCTYRIMDVYSSFNILFTNCEFRDNTGSALANFQYVSDFAADGCSFLRNEAIAMFYPSQSQNITVRNTEFIDNNVEELVRPDDGDIELDASNRFENNAFDGTR